MDELRAGLQRFPGIGPVGADIFCREAQGIWAHLRPYADQRVIEGAARLGLPTSPGALGKLVPGEHLPHLAAGCVRAELDADVAADVQRHLP